MGEVYRATDTTLGREVALKLLPKAFASDAERLARFEREAKLLASLSHPGIAHLYGFERVTLPDGDHAHVLVMELAPGEDLGERLKRGRVPVDEAIAIARQIAEALESAHDRGVVHRDVKPANVKVAPDGSVKVLDFGLARAWSGDAADAVSGTSAALSQSPTLAHSGTAAGLILGTAAYMSPEQARGKAVDKRADVWAFGVVLYEMLTGRRLFAGETVTDVLAAVVKDPVDWSALPRETPARLRSLLERCLERDAKQRLRDIGEARIALARAAAAATEERATAPLAPKRASLALGFTAAIAAGIGALAAWQLRPAAPAAAVVRVIEAVPAGFVPGVRSRARMSLSPDGSKLVFVANSRLYVRSLDTLALTELPGTSRAWAPFFSPDGAWVGFSLAPGLKKVRLTGGEPVAISGANGRAAWSPDGTILVAGDYAGILGVPEQGGEASVLVTPEPGWSYDSVQPLRGGRELLYTRFKPGAEAAETVVRSRDRDDATVVLRAGFNTRYVGSGHLVYSQRSQLVAVAFELASRRVLSEPVVVADQVAFSSSSGIAHFTLSEGGLLAYEHGVEESQSTRLVAVSRSGALSRLPTETRNYSDPRVSPDGRRIAAHLQGDLDDVWVADASRGALTRLSVEPGEDETPVWSPDGHYLAWSGSRAGTTRAVFRRLADGSGDEELLWRTEAHTHVNDWTPDGRALVLQLVDTKTASDLWLLPLDTKQAAPWLATPFSEHSARVSPDGRFVAYVSDESGREEVYVRSFSGAGARVQVSASGGGQPVWSRDGRSLVFRGDGGVQEAAFRSTPEPAAESPRVLFADRFASPQAGTHTGYDVFPDGRFLMVEDETTAASAGATAASQQIVYVFGFFEDLKRRVKPERR
jgi:eukaryotic-like serine/threonine-protein kinase